MEWFWALFSLLHPLSAVVAIAFVLRGRKEPVSMIAWILAISLLPVIGIVGYVLLGADRIRRRASVGRRRVAGSLQRVQAAADREVRRALPDLPEAQRGIARIGRRLVDMPVTEGNAVRAFHDAEAIYAALAESIGQAEDHLHLQYYIWRADETGRRFRDLLIERARAGVAVRLLLDAVGCWRLSRSFLRPLRAAGVELAFFMPFAPLRRRWSPNLRNHRKIVVVDGQVGFVGSQNIGDEYRGLRKQLSPWHDTHLRIDGPAVTGLQQTFAEDWLFATRQELSGPRYFEPVERSGTAAVQILPTGPQQQVAVLGQVMFAAISAARDSIRIVTPYFVPSASLREALKLASYRGVRVEVVVSARTDAPFVLWCARSYYGELLEAGIRLYEFDHGMLHAKTVTFDDQWAMVGSANMDVRSFRLNFEITALLYDVEVTGRLVASCANYRKRSRKIQASSYRARGIGYEWMEGVARLFTPLL